MNQIRKMIDARVAIEKLKELYHNGDTVQVISHNLAIGSCIDAIEHLAQENTSYDKGKD